MGMENTFGARTIRAWVDQGRDPSELPICTGMTLERIERTGVIWSQPYLRSVKQMASGLGVEPGWLLYGDQYLATEMLAQMREQTGLLRELVELARAANPE